MGIWVHPEVEDIINIIIIITIIIMGCTQIPISTLSHIWVFVRLYGIVFVIIVIIIIIIMIIMYALIIIIIIMAPCLPWSCKLVTIEHLINGK